MVQFHQNTLGGPPSYVRATTERATKTETNTASVHIRRASISIRCPAEENRHSLHTLTLVSRVSTVEALGWGRLCPRLVRWLLATTVATGARWSAVAHGLSTIARRRLCRRTAVSLLLTTILTCICINTTAQTGQII